MDVQTLSKQFGVNAERKTDGGFPVFFRRVSGKNVLVLTDGNTLPLSAELTDAMREAGIRFSVYTLPEREPVADERTVQGVLRHVAGHGYLLAVGAGTLNDLAKYAGSLTGTPSGVLATAPSMDGYTSGVAPLIERGSKVTRQAQIVSDILLDDRILSAAPKIMIGAGVGDILAKYCCLTDWRISSYLTGEEYGEEAAALMFEAVRACDETISDLIKGEKRGVEKLMDALLVSGYAMAKAGNSRPASGAEHHMSHFLEMDFLRRGKPIPLHGVKVGLGTAVSLYLYHTLKDRAPFRGCEAVYREAEKLPSPEYVLDILRALGCPTRFSQLDVSVDTVRRMFFEAYLIRDRFTILTLYCTHGLMAGAADELLERFY